MIETREITSRAEWLKWRRQDVTASDVAALCGLSPWKSALEVWAEKTGYANHRAETGLMRRGRWLEPAVLEALRETYPDVAIQKASVYLRDPELRLGATPDAFMLGAFSTLIECKVISRPVYDAWGDDAPIYYQLQTLTGAMLANTDRAILACLVIDTYSAELVTFHVERNEEAEAKIREGVAAFWENTALGIRPQIDYGEDGALIARLFRLRDDLPPIDLTGDNRLPDILAEREALNAQIKAQEARCEAIKAEVVHKLNGAPAAICGAWKVTHKLVHQAEQIRKAYDYARLTITKRKE
jgi:putative phage-type endonuclease